MLKDILNIDFKALKLAPTSSGPLKVVHAAQKPGKDQEDTEIWVLATKNSKIYVAAKRRLLYLCLGSRRLVHLLLRSSSEVRPS